MAVFSSTEEAEKVFGEFFEQIVVDPDLRPKFVAANTSFRANYTDPDSTLSLDATQDPPVVKTGADAKADSVEVEMNMSADNGHRFWLGDLNIPMALARGKVKVHGPVGKLLKLLPAMQPAFAMYKAFLQERGLQDKIGA